MMAALGSLPRLNPARDGREGEDARLWKRVRSLETNLGYSNLALDDLPFGKNPGAGHILWHADDSYGSHADDYGSHRGGQHRKRRAPRSGPPTKFLGPAQKKTFENTKSTPSLSSLLPYGKKTTPFTQSQEPLAQRTVELHRGRPIVQAIDGFPVPLQEGDEHNKSQAGPPGSMTAMVARSLESFCGDAGGPLPPRPDASQCPPSGATANNAEVEPGQSSPCSAQHPMVASFVPAGVSNASPNGVWSTTTIGNAARVPNSFRSATTIDSSARVQATSTTESSANAFSLHHRDEEGDFNADVGRRRSDAFPSVAVTNGINSNSANCYRHNSSVGQQQDFPQVERRTSVNNELMVVNEKAGGSKPRKKLRVRVSTGVPPGQKLRTIRAVYCRSLVSPNNPLTSNTVVARVKQGLQSGCEKRPKVLLVGSGTFNPVHKLHIRRFYLARNFLEAQKGMRVVGGIVSPSHPTLVRQRHRVRAAEIIPPKHRLSMARAAVGEGSWLAVDPWEVTRKRIMDYMSVLEHAREVCQETFPSHAGDIAILYMCQTSQIHHLNPTMLRTGGFGVITVCRPLEKERLQKELSPSFRNLAILVEDSAILSAELERTSSTMVRHLLKQGKSVEGMVGKAVARYIRDNDIAQRVSGKHKWTVEDNAFMFEQEDKDDRPYYNLPRIYMRRESQMPLHY